MRLCAESYRQSVVLSLAQEPWWAMGEVRACLWVSFRASRECVTFVGEGSALEGVWLLVVVRNLNIYTQFLSEILAISYISVL